jgi:Spy/CpxP family protein refolding chaperone
MKRHLAWVFLITLAGSSVAFADDDCDRQAGQPQNAPAASGKLSSKPGQPEPPPRKKWWIDPDSRRELNLSDKQAAEIDRIFESIAPKQRDLWHEVERLDGELARTIKDSTADPATVAQQADRVERLRAEWNRNRTVMLYRMNLVLNPEQRAKVKEMHDRREEARRRQGDKADRRE